MNTYTRWGPWWFDRDRLVLTTGGEREVDLERCLSAPAILDWVAQYAGRLDEKALGWLMRALVDLLDPQSWACSWGMTGGEGRSIDREEIRELVLNAERETLAYRLEEQRVMVLLETVGHLFGGFRTQSLEEVHEEHEAARREVDEWFARMEERSYGQDGAGSAGGAGAGG